jgi:1-acyl-sn-glycerol-3-phosphate acyltransferase
MNVLRSLFFNVTFILWTALLSIAALPALLFGTDAAIGIGKLWARSLMGMARFMCGLSHEIRGLENLPEGPVLVAAKHQSMWDTLVLSHQLRRPCFVLKQELTRIPLFGWYLRRGGMVAVNRDGGAKALRLMVAQAREAAEDGRTLIIFPEGTRVRPGDDAPYHPGVAALYQQLGLPVVPVALNSGLFWPRHGFVKTPGRIVIEFLPPIPPGLPRKSFLPRLKEEIETRTDALVAAAARASGD